MTYPGLALSRRYCRVSKSLSSNSSEGRAAPLTGVGEKEGEEGERGREEKKKGREGGREGGREKRKREREEREKGEERGKEKNLKMK